MTDFNKIITGIRSDITLMIENVAEIERKELVDLKTDELIEMVLIRDELLTKIYGYCDRLLDNLSRSES